MFLGDGRRAFVVLAGIRPYRLSLRAGPPAWRPAGDVDQADLSPETDTFMFVEIKHEFISKLLGMRIDLPDAHAMSLREQGIA